MCTCEVFIDSLELIMLGETVWPMRVTSLLLDENDEAKSRVVKEDNVQTDVQHSRVFRHCSILRCLVDGDSNKVIARKLCITEATVKVYVRAILPQTASQQPHPAHYLGDERVRAETGPPSVSFWRALRPLSTCERAIAWSLYSRRLVAIPVLASLREMWMAPGPDASVFLLKVTPRMTEAGAAVLTEQFGKPPANPGKCDYERVAQAVFEAMLASCPPGDLVYRPRENDPELR
jgi:two-component system nitrate/nitrite response regulator NarL